MYIDNCKLLKFNAVVIDIMLNTIFKIDKLKLLKSMNMYIIARIVVFDIFNPLDLIYLDYIRYLVGFNT